MAEESRKETEVGVNCGLHSYLLGNRPVVARQESRAVVRNGETENPTSYLSSDSNEGL